MKRTVEITIGENTLNTVKIYNVPYNDNYEERIETDIILDFIKRDIKKHGKKDYIDFNGYVELFKTYPKFFDEFKKRLLKDFHSDKNISLERSLIFNSIEYKVYDDFIPYCSYCKNEKCTQVLDEPIKTNIYFKLGNTEIFILNVPIIVCSTCYEMYITEDTYNKLKNILKSDILKAKKDRIRIDFESEILFSMDDYKINIKKSKVEKDKKYSIKLSLCEDNKETEIGNIPVIKDENGVIIVDNHSIIDFISSINSKTVDDRSTVSIATLKNGFKVVENSSAVSKKNYDEKIGEEINYKRIKDKVWELLGFITRFANNYLENNN